MSAAQPLPLDPVEAALEAVKRLDKALRSMCAKDGNLKADAVARRAKDAPQLILQSGLTSTLAFMLSKLDNSRKRRAYGAAVASILGGEARGNICENASGEGGGYPQVAALLLAYASRVANCDSSKIGNLDSGLVECLENIKAGGVRAERLVLRYIEEVKKLTTALYGE